MKNSLYAKKHSDVELKIKVIHSSNLLILLVLCVFITSCKTARQSANTPVRIEVKQDSGATFPIEKIPILAWYGVNEHTVERYHELKECGFDYNLSFYGGGVDELVLALDAAEAAGVKIIINCPELKNEPEKVASRLKDHPALAGYQLVDEPNRNDFPNWGELTRRIQAVDSQHFCYINLFPNYASSEQLGTSTYQEYVQLFLKEIPIPLLSFDHYPIKVNASGVRSLNSGWYENLEIISDEARRAGKPFWAFALTTAHWSYPIPTLADLRLQVYSNLAYGAQGIQYFTYWTPSINEGADFHNGPIDYHTQQKTATWYTVQKMNREIKALSMVFLGAEVIQVRHIVKTALGINGTVPTGTMRFNFAKRPEEATIIKTFTIPSNTKAVVSFLKNGNRCYMVIVNRNLEGGNNVTFTIKGDKGLQLIQKDGTAVDASMAGSRQTVTPGDVLIYGWDI
jgi:hypothetical protein